MQPQRSPLPSPAEKPPPKRVNLGGGGGFARRLVVALLLVPLKEVYDLPIEGEPWQNLPRPPPFKWSSQRNLDAPIAAFEIDGRHTRWSPSLTTKPAGFEDVSYERLLDTWAETQSAQELERLKEKCVFDWGPGFKLPNWWRIKFHEDDTYRTLLTAWVDNYRPWQPGLAVSPSSFIKYGLPEKHDYGAAAARCLAIDHDLREIARAAYRAKLAALRLERIRCPVCHRSFATFTPEQIHFDHMPFTRIWRGDVCWACNTKGLPLWDAFGPVHAKRQVGVLVEQSAVRGVECFTPE